MFRTSDLTNMLVMLPLCPVSSLSVLYMLISHFTGEQIEAYTD